MAALQTTKQAPRTAIGKPNKTIASRAETDEESLDAIVAEATPQKHCLAQTLPIWQPLPNTIDRLPPNTLIGDYRIIRQLGSGSFGTVYEAEHTQTKDRVALKIAQGRGPVNALSTEAAATQRLPQTKDQAACYGFEIYNHLISADSKEPIAYAVFKLLDGPVFSDVIKNTPMAPLRAINLFIGLVEKLIAAKIPHGDLKPGNLKLVNIDGQEHLIPFDWGLATLLHYNLERNKSLAKENRVFIGTPQFIAPEVFLDLKEEGVAAVDLIANDIYALAVCLYEAIVGEGAFRRSTTVGEVLHKKINDRLPPFIWAYPNNPADKEQVAEIIRFGLAPKERENIPETIFALPRWLAYPLQRIVWQASAQRSVDRECFYTRKQLNPEEQQSLKAIITVVITGMISEGKLETDQKEAMAEYLLDETTKQYSDIFLFDRYESLQGLLSDLVKLQNKIIAWERKKVSKLSLTL